jgi:homopolymeric O-antigen transport system ATP-binding protein
MSDIVIRSENLAKKYTIGHIGRARHTTLIDVLAREARTAIRRANDFVYGRPIVAGDELEEVWALRDVSFEVARGDIIGIIGKNGAGKSTLLKILSRITEPTLGKVTIEGRVASLLEVGTGFHPELSGRENIFLNGAILGMSRKEIKREFDAIVSFAEVERFLDTPVKRYSSGMYVRLAFAVAAHLESDILIVDEVLAVGDAAFQKRCMGKMKEATGAGRTVLFVSHSMGAVATLCKTAVLLDEGTVKAIGPAEKIVSYYLEQLLTPGTNDLSQLRVSGLGQKIRFTSIELMGDQGGSVAYGMPLRIRLKVASDVSMRDVTVGASIFAANATPVGTLLTEESFSISAGEELSMELQIANTRLAPGAYYAGLSLGTGGVDGSRTDFEIVIGAPYFHIIPGTGTPYIVANWNSNNWGHILLGKPLLRVC